MSEMMVALLGDDALLEAFAAAIHDHRAPAIGRKTMWRDKTADERQLFILGVSLAIRRARASQVSPLAGEPLPNAPAIGVVLCEALQFYFPSPRFRDSRLCKGAARRKAYAREAQELRELWAPAVVAGVRAYCRALCLQLGEPGIAEVLPGLDAIPQRTAA